MRKNITPSSYEQDLNNQCAEELGRQFDSAAKAFMALHLHRESLAALHATALLSRLQRRSVPSL